MTVYNPQRALGVLIGSLIGANFNSTADQQITITHPYSKVQIQSIRVTNASTSLTTAAGGIYTGASKSGTTIIAASQVYSALTASNLVLTPPVSSPASLTAFDNTLTLYFSLTTAQGATATADIYVFGIPFEF